MVFFKTILLVIILLPATVPAAGNGADATRFWTTFRQALLDRNSSQVLSMTRFPFEVRGVDDSSPLRRYDRKAFPKVLKQVVSQEELVLSGGNFISKTMLQLIQEKKALNSADYLTPTYIRIHDLEFQLVNGHWLFTGVYLEE